MITSHFTDYDELSCQWVNIVAIVDHHYMKSNSHRDCTVNYYKTTDCIDINKFDKEFSIEVIFSRKKRKINR